MYHQLIWYTVMRAHSDVLIKLGIENANIMIHLPVICRSEMLSSTGNESRSSNNISEELDNSSSSTESHEAAAERYIT